MNLFPRPRKCPGPGFVRRRLDACVSRVAMPVRLDVLLLALLFAAGGAQAQVTMGLVSSQLVSQPVAAPDAVRSAHAWRSMVGGMGESFVTESLKLRGYEVLEIKTGGNQGIDRIAFRRGRDGRLLDVKFIEVKTSYDGRARMGRTRAGPQMSRQWLAEKLRTMRRSPDPQVRWLALETGRLRRRLGVAISHFGEIHTLNVRRGTYVIRGALTGNTLAEMSIPRTLRQLAQKARSRTARVWAARHLRHWSSVRGTSMRSWIRSAPGAAAGAGAASRVALRRAAARGIPLVGAAVAVGWDGIEIYGDVAAYRQGRLARRDLHRRLATRGGGWAGAVSLGAVGAYVGSFGGPAAWITVPVTATGFAIVGYFSGSELAGVGVDHWYASIDEQTLKDAEAQLFALSYQDAKALQEEGRSP